jgi:hypothetical protein
LGQAQEAPEKDTFTRSDYTQTVTKILHGKRGTFEIKDYAPSIFKHIRTLFGIRTEDYVNSWQDPKTETGLSASAGRSGSMFYRTDDKRYFFKTILHPEVGVMMEMLQDYHNYLRECPTTFIMKVFGLHRVTYGALKTNKIWVLVFGNVFPPDVTIDEIYDLKGRKPKPGKHYTERPVAKKKGPFKDNEISRQIYFPDAEVYRHFVTQLQRDIALLCRHNVMDYSLLIGIHIVTDDEKKQLETLRAQGEEKTKTKTKRRKENMSDTRSGTKNLDTERKSDTRRDKSRNPGDGKRTSHHTTKEKTKRTNAKSDDENELMTAKADNSQPDPKNENTSTDVTENKESKNENTDDASKTVTKEKSTPQPNQQTKRRKERKTETPERKENGTATSSNAQETSGEEKKSKERLTTSSPRSVNNTNQQLDSSTRTDNDKGEITTKGRILQLVRSGGTLIPTHLYFFGGFHGQHPVSRRDEVLFIGIIDCLTGYALQKKVAHFFKRFVWESSMLSTVRAKYYAKRFHHFMTKKLIFDPTRATSSSSSESWDFDDSESDDVIGTSSPTPERDTTDIRGSSTSIPFVISGPSHIKLTSARTKQKVKRHSDEPNTRSQPMGSAKTHIRSHTLANAPTPRQSNRSDTTNADNANTTPEKIKVNDERPSSASTYSHQSDTHPTENNRRELQQEQHDTETSTTNKNKNREIRNTTENSKSRDKKKSDKSRSQDNRAEDKETRNQKLSLNRDTEQEIERYPETKTSQKDGTEKPNRDDNSPAQKMTKDISPRRDEKILKSAD